MLRVCLFTNIVLAAADCAPGGECTPSTSGTQLLQRTQTVGRHLSEHLSMDEEEDSEETMVNHVTSDVPMEEMPNGGEPQISEMPMSKMANGERPMSEMPNGEVPMSEMPNGKTSDPMEMPMEERPMKMMLASDPTSTGSWEQVTCPVMGALLRGGDLIPDENGHVNKIQVRDAMLRVGISRAKSIATTDGNFDHLPEPKEIKLFNMDLGMASAKSQEVRNKEHDFSTGVRDGAEPSSSAYTVFEGFIGTDGDDQTWSQRDVLTAIAYYRENSNDEGSGEGGITSLSVMLHEFQNSDGKLSKSEMKELFLNSNYPGEFMERRAQAVEDWEAGH